MSFKILSQKFDGSHFIYALQCQTCFSIKRISMRSTGSARGLESSPCRQCNITAAKSSTTSVTREEVDLLAKHLAAGIRVNGKQQLRIKELEQKLEQERALRNTCPEPLIVQDSALARRLELELEHNNDLREKLAAANHAKESGYRNYNLLLDQNVALQGELAERDRQIAELQQQLAFWKV